MVCEFCGPLSCPSANVNDMMYIGWNGGEVKGTAEGKTPAMVLDV